jgi:ribosomal protein S13
MKDSEIESIKARLADQIKEADDLMSQHKELIKRIKEISAEKSMYWLHIAIYEIQHVGK